MTKLEEFKIWLEQFNHMIDKPVSEWGFGHTEFLDLIRCHIIELLPYMASEIEFWCMPIPSEFLQAEYLFPITTIDHE